MSATLQNLRDLVRSTLDFTTDDLPDSRLDVYIRDGFYKIINQEQRWPFYENTYTLTTTAGQRAYTFASIDANLLEVTSIVDNTSVGWRLEYRSQDELEEIFLGTLDSPQRPRYFSIWSQSVQLWPKPDTVYSFTLRGYRKPTDWVAQGSGATVDCDDRLHWGIALYALARVYAEQEDPEMSSFYMTEFGSVVANATDSIMRAPSYLPVALNRGSLSFDEERWLRMQGRRSNWWL